MKQMPWEYPNCKVGQIYDMGEGSTGEVIHAWKNGSACIRVIDGPGKGIEWCVNGQSTSVYRLIKDVN